MATENDLPTDNKYLRSSIKNRELYRQLEDLWSKAKPLQGLQKGITDQGQDHCFRVEGYIWNLIGKEKDKFKDEDFFILSASAALHDIGKIEESSKVQKELSSKSDHGFIAKEKILTDDRIKTLFEDKGLREAVANIIGVHNNGSIDSLPDEEFAIGTAGILLRSLASIFRLADMLDSDYRRCNYLLISFKKLTIPEQIMTWEGRSLIRGTSNIDTNSREIILQATTNNEHEKVAILAYLDSLNESFTSSQIKYLENCPVQFQVNGIYKKDTIYFPSHFSIKINGVLKGGLVEYYKEIAREYITIIGNNFSQVNLRGIGEFSESKRTELAKIFIDVNVTLYSGLAPLNFASISSLEVKEYSDSQPISKALTLKKLRRIVLLGEPGSGKSTISQYYLLKYANKINDEGLQNGVPFIALLREFVSSKTSKNLTLQGLIEYLNEQVIKELGHSALYGFVEFWLSQPNSLVIFDGLDEVVRIEDKKQISETIRELADKFPKVKILLTSRLVGYDEAPLDRNIFLHLVLQGLELEQIKKFVIDWNEDREENLHERNAAISGFLEALNDHAVAELATNPLLLTIMILVQKAEADLPKERALLYGKCVEAFMVNRVKAKDLPISFDEGEIRSCHEFLGYWMHCQSETMGNKFSGVSLTEIKENLAKDIIKRSTGMFQITQQEAIKRTEDFIEAARRRVGLIVERSGGIWSFGHGSFQEYFAARFISQNNSGIIEIWSEINDKIEKSHWVEPLKLLAGIYGHENRRTLDLLIDRLIQEYTESYDPHYKVLILSGEIAGEVNLKPKALNEISNTLICQLFDNKDEGVMDNCKRVLNHFYNTPFWPPIVEKVKKQGYAIKLNPSAYSGSAFSHFIFARQFGYTRIDNILKIL